MDGKQPDPIPTGGPHIADLVMADMAARKQHGIETYGVALQAGNGRDALQDLYEELLDAVVYTRQLIEERKAAFDETAQKVAGAISRTTTGVNITYTPGQATVAGGYAVGVQHGYDYARRYPPR